MTDYKILVPVDFTEASNKAAITAASMARIFNMEITLLNICDDSKKQAINHRLNELAIKLKKNYDAAFNILTRKGKLHDEIARAANEPNNALMIIGSHGFKGLREILLGVDILKLVKKISIPTLCVQKNYEFPEDGIKKILLPASSHASFQNIVDAVAFLAGLFGSEVHIYAINKGNHPWPDTLRQNLDLAVKALELNKIVYKKTVEEENLRSPGFSSQILSYAEKNNTDMICVMAPPSDEYYYFADYDKEKLLTNKLQIPVLCASDIKSV
jgi:nucleotide-binding universal stress UspA family protein